MTTWPTKTRSAEQSGVEVDGESRIVHVRGGSTLNDEGRQALGLTVSVVGELLNQRDPHWASRQDLIRTVRVAQQWHPRWRGSHPVPSVVMELL